jgi:hypothetical protein
VRENPAENPTRVWAGNPGSEEEARLLLKRTDPAARRLLQTLIASAGTFLSARQLAEEVDSAVTVTEVRSLLEKVNLFAEIFGYISIVEIAGDCYRVIPTTARVVHHALEANDR